MGKDIVPGQKALVMNPKDNVATAIQHLQAGERVEVARGDGQPPVVVELRQPIPFGHKLALEPIPKGEPVRKYGELIGLATAPIEAGEHVHVHNVESTRARGDVKTKARG